MSDPDPRHDTATFSTVSTGSKPPSSGSEALHPGQRLAERYEIRSLLGRGGMGEVWLAFDLKLRVEVALKSILPERLGSEARREALRREVRAAREVVSPNVCRVFDLVDAEGQELVSMEYVDGQTLTRLLQDHSPLGPGEVRDLASQFLAGLEAIHHAGLVHRDFKPENVMVTRAGRVVVMDLGITTPLQARGETVAGTAAYMAPEQERGEEVDARADVFAAGVVLAEMTAPAGIADEDARKALRAGLRQDPPRVLEGPWSGVIRKAISPQAPDRYASARELSRALDGVSLRVQRGEDRQPYPGLVAFTQTQAEHFFGREAEVEALLRKLGPARLLAIAGPSGAGKSSFVQAGLVPALPPGWDHVVFHPRERPFASLAQALLPELAGDAEAMGELLRMEEPEAALSALRRWRRRQDHALLVADQFEELFTQCPPDVQARFAELLGCLPLEADVHVLISLRDDFLIRCHEHEALAPAVSDLTLLSAPTGAALRRALLQPALSCGYRFEDEALVEEMLGEVERERGALPLLAFAAARLWDHRDREHGLLTREAYVQVGGVAGALARHAEATLGQIGGEQEPVVRELFRNLVTAQGTRAVREREELLSVFEDSAATGQPGDGSVAEGVNSVRTELSGGPSGHRGGSRTEAEKVLNALVDARLLTSFERTRDESGEGRQEIEIVHESLLTAWPRLVRWQTQDADGAQLRDQLRQAARFWDEKGRPHDLLWSGTPFLEYRAWRARYPGRLSAMEEDFALAMTALANRRRRRRRVATITLITTTTLATIVVSLLWRRAETQALRAEASNLLSLGRLELENQPATALAYAMASLERADNEPARRFALEVLWSGPLAFQISDSTRSVMKWSPDGEWLALWGLRGVLFVSSDLSERQELQVEYAGVTSEFEGFTADNSRIMTVTGTPRLTELVLWSFPQLERLKSWEIRDGRGGELRDRMIISLQREPGAGQMLVGRVQSIDGGSIRTLGRWADDGGDTRLLDSRLEWRASVEDGRIVKRRLSAPEAPPRVLGRHGGDVTLVWYPWRERLVTADDTGVVHIWNAESGGLVRTFRSPASARGVRLDPSGRYVAAAPGLQVSRGSMVVFDLEAPAGAEPIFLRHKVPILNQMRFHPEGQLLATGHYPRGVLLWNLASRRSIVLRGADTGEKPGARFLPDGRLVHMSRSGDLRLWPLWTGTGDAPRTLWTPRVGPDPAIPISTSADGRFLAVLERSAGELTVVPLDGSRAVVHEVARGNLMGLKVAPDGRRAAYLRAAGEGTSLRLVDLETGEETALPPGVTSGECGLAGPGKVAAETPAWLPDGRLVSYGTLGLRLWNLEEKSSQQLWPCLDSTEPHQILASPDGRTVLTLANAITSQSSGVSTLLAYDLDTRRAREITGHGKRLSSMALDDTGTVLLTGDSEGVVRVGRLDGGDPHLLLGHTGFVGSVDASPDGRWVASAAADGTLRLWPMPDLTTPPLHTLPAPELLAKLRKLTNLRVVEDSDSETGYDVEPGPFQGWAVPPTW